MALVKMREGTKRAVRRRVFMRRLNLAQREAPPIHEQVACQSDVEGKGNGGNW